MHAAAGLLVPVHGQWRRHGMAQLRAFRGRRTWGSSIANDLSEMNLSATVWATLLEYSEWSSTGVPGTLALAVLYGTTIDSGIRVPRVLEYPGVKVTWN